MRAKIQKWGNSIGVLLPKTILQEAGIAPGSNVDLSIEERRIVLAPVRRPRYRLADLVARITPKNRHDGLDFGPPRGHEVW